MYMNDGNKTKINLRNKSVFITGVAGFIGSNLAKRLLSTVEGVKVVGLDNMNHYYDYEEDFSFVRSDYRSGAGCLLVPHHPHRIHGREDQLWPDSGDHHPERQAQLLHSLCAEYPQGQQQAAG